MKDHSFYVDFLIDIPVSSIFEWINDLQNINDYEYKNFFKIIFKHIHVFQDYPQDTEWKVSIDCFISNLL